MLLLLILLLNGCASSAATRQTPPPRPTLQSLTPTSDGGICMDRADAQELLLYINQLQGLLGVAPAAPEGKRE